MEDDMGAISLKLPDSLLEASGKCAGALRVSRAEYIRRAIEQMNRATRSEIRAKRLAAVSKRVRKESMRVNTEFAAIEHHPDA
jgi:metal-responsive CopG/Arc/MetJ family transcriptional regulator